MFILDHVLLLEIFADSLPAPGDGQPDLVFALGPLQVITKFGKGLVKGLAMVLFCIGQRTIHVKNHCLKFVHAGATGRYILFF